MGKPGRSKRPGFLMPGRKIMEESTEIMIKLIAFVLHFILMEATGVIDKRNAAKK
ncbi:MAG: hypothetical protein JNM88_15045 [Chitinophagaceae bacterium]|nr:hypothetical protein [Chitinophagaceae bacterium]